MTIEHIIRNFTQQDKLRAAMFDFGDEAHVMLAQSSASLSFQFNMTPNEARRLAAVLDQLAELADKHIASRKPK